MRILPTQKIVHFHSNVHQSQASFPTSILPNMRRALLPELLFFLITLSLLSVTVGLSFNVVEQFSHASRNTNHSERKFSHYCEHPILEKNHYINVSHLENEARGQEKNNAHDNEKKGNSNDDISDESEKAEAHSANHKKKIEAAIIASIFGGLLFLLICLILTMCLRRYREKRHNDGSPGVVEGREDENHIVARRICGIEQERMPRRLMTLFGTEGQSQGDAFLSREGDTGWTYMNHIARGLERSTLTTSQLYNDNFDRSNRRQNNLSQQKDAELPSYSMIDLHHR